MIIHMNVQRRKTDRFFPCAAACLLGGLFFLSSCGSDEETFDAQGVFEAQEIIVSAEAAGRITRLELEEGVELAAGQVVGSIDSTQAALLKKQLQAQIGAVLSQAPDVAAQIAALQEQIAAAKRERNRLESLVAVGALPAKQLDDAATQVDVLARQLDALQSSLSVTRRGLQAQTVPLTAQIEQVNDQIAKSVIVNPINGTVLTKYAEQEEVTAPGKPLYKIADLSTMILRAYISGTQFANVKVGAPVKVFVDNGPDSYREMPGTISWISDQAEFTPKTIRTKEERANLVYAIKIRVPNDGALKIGMYGEVRF